MRLADGFAGKRKPVAAGDALAGLVGPVIVCGGGGGAPPAHPPGGARGGLEWKLAGLWGGGPPRARGGGGLG
ncbi:hypothetical protein EGJ16_15120, partial [Serratia marcescens]